MDIKNLKPRIIAAIILAFILFYPVGYSMYFDSQHKSIDYEVIDTTSSVNIRSTGKYSNVTVLNHYIKIRYDNGYVSNITTSDPYYYNSYPIGSRHTVNFDNIIFGQDYDEVGIKTSMLYTVGEFLRGYYFLILAFCSVIGAITLIIFTIGYIFTGERFWEQ